MSDFGSIGSFGSFAGCDGDCDCDCDCSGCDCDCPDCDCKCPDCDECCVQRLSGCFRAVMEICENFVCCCICASTPTTNGGGGERRDSHDSDDHHGMYRRGSYKYKREAVFTQPTSGNGARKEPKKKDKDKDKSGIDDEDLTGEELERMVMEGDGEVWQPDSDAIDLDKENKTDVGATETTPLELESDTNYPQVAPPSYDDVITNPSDSQDNVV